MKIRLAQPLGFSQPGGRPANEDTLFPDPQVVTPQQTWFMVCDGVGGAARGAVASQLAARQFDAYFRAYPVPVVTADYLQQALNSVQNQFDAYVGANDSAAGMGTTLALVYRHEAGLTVAHLGDSRVYLVRNGRIQWRTDDHSYVNELVKGGVLTANQARHHPQRNIITRAIQSGARPPADVQLISDLRPGDYFFLCSDGVLERVSDELLENVLGSANSNREKMQILLDCCQDQTRDNFTAYLLQIEAVSGECLPGFSAHLPPYERPVSATADEATVVALAYPDQSLPSTFRAESIPNRPAFVQAEPLPDAPPTDRRRSSFAPIMGVLTVLLVMLGGYVGWKVLGQPGWPAQPGATIPVDVGLISASRSSESVRPQPVSSLSLPKAIPQARPQPAASQRPTVERRVPPDLYVGVVDGKRGLLLADQTTWLVTPQFDKIGRFRDGLARVRLGSKRKYLSLRGNTYDEISPAHCDRIRVRAGDEWGFLNRNGEVAIGLRYLQASSFHNDCTARVTIGTQSFRIDRLGRDVKTGRGPVTSTDR